MRGSTWITAPLLKPDEVVEHVQGPAGADGDAGGVEEQSPPLETTLWRPVTGSTRMTAPSFWFGTPMSATTMLPFGSTARS